MNFLSRFIYWVIFAVKKQEQNPVALGLDKMGSKELPLTLNPRIQQTARWTVLTEKQLKLDEAG